MANSDRSRFEIHRRRVYPTTGSDVIRKGDLLVVSSGNARPASSVTTTDGLGDAFIGVALHAKPSTDTPEIVVGVDGIFEMDCSALASVANVGDKVEGSVAAGAIELQVVAVDTSSSDAIGRVAKAGAVGDTTLTVHLVGGGVAGPAVAD
jgi:hypothetical protein